MSSANKCPFDFNSINERLKECPDITAKKVYIEGKYEAFFLYVSNHIDKDLIQRDFISPILSMTLDQFNDKKIVSNLPCSELEFINDTQSIITGVLEGSALFLSPQLPYALSYKNPNVVKRSLEEPTTEKNVRGAHAGFIEVLDVNIAILRRIIRSDRLKFKTITLATIAKQDVAIAYIDGIANIDLVNVLYDKISSIKADGFTAIGYIEQKITPHPHSIFPQFLSTERPDKVKAALLEGRIAVLQAGTPVALIAPVTFISFYQALDDYSTQWIHGTFLRLIRIIGGFFLAVFLPSLYIAITTYHYYAVPLTLLITLAETRSKVPFPPIIEVLILEITVEMIREAAIRLPTYVGTAISVMAALVIGQAAVEAGIVSSLVIVIVAATAIASYVIPSNDMSLAIRILRFIFIVSSALFGMIGIVVCTAFALAHIIALESLGQPYFAPFSPWIKKDLKDTIFRMPLKKMKRRPKSVRPEDPIRSENNGGK